MFREDTNHGLESIKNNAEEGDTIAQYNLALASFYGEGVKMDK